MIENEIFHDEKTWIWTSTDILAFNSFYKNRFRIDSFKTKDPNSEFKYKGWFGVKELPQFLQTNDDLPEGTKQYIYSITSR